MPVLWTARPDEVYHELATDAAFSYPINPDAPPGTDRLDRLVLLVRCRHRRLCRLLNAPECRFGAGVDRQDCMMAVAEQPQSCGCGGGGGGDGGDV